MITDHVIEAKALRFGHPGGFTLEVPDLTIRPGEFVALTGPSGSGKTTLIDLFAGIRLATQGDLRVLGRRWSDLPEARRRAVRLSEVGMAFQEFELLPYLSARDNIELGRFIAGIPAAEARRRSDLLADRAGIRHTLPRPPAELSQGERQRVCLCRALLPRPRLILCDEPTGNLDPATTASVMDLLLSQAAEDGAAVVVATHDHGLLPRFHRTVRLGGPR